MRLVVPDLQDLRCCSLPPCLSPKIFQLDLVFLFLGSCAVGPFPCASMEFALCVGSSPVRFVLFSPAGVLQSLASDTTVPGRIRLSGRVMKVWLLSCEVVCVFVKEVYATVVWPSASPGLTGLTVAVAGAGVCGSGRL
ncbi:unnamed protein product [Microthlaspi erraticum]|uniref:Uncharacterized protein n=1 Tax=Microthlaspi erraticum TaxID=1685480 RepID=A0A6D2J992_9BRAS|nr:unnamed protein product [Microthlaspi erraticum]